MHSVMNTILAASPIFLALILLLMFKMSSMRTAIITYLLAVVLSLLPLRFHTSSELALHASIEGILISIIVIYVLVFGLFLYNILKSSGAIQTISEVLSQHAQSPVEQALLISAALGPFLESTSGFGVGIVIAAPLYLAIGFEPRKAALLSLLTQSAVPWGALAVGTVINAELSHTSLQALGVVSSVVTIPLYLLYAITVVFVTGGWKGVRKNIGSILVVWVLLSVSTWVGNEFISTQLAGVLAGFITTIGLLVYWKLVSKLHLKSTIQERAATVNLNPNPDINSSPNSNFNSNPNSNPIFKTISVRSAVLPYGILVAYLLGSNLIPWFSSFLASILDWRLPSYGYELQVVYNPGFALLVASVSAILVYQLKWKQITDCVRATFRQVYPAAVSTTGFVAMSTVMQQSGMINLLSANLASALGSAFLFISPLIGGMGGFITGSNSAANAMFSPFQSAMAHKLHRSDLLFATAQNVSASNMTMASPSRISLAAAVSNQSGMEGELTRSILPISLGALIIVLICCLCLQPFIHL